MLYQRLDGEFPCLKNSAVALGKFDGVHRGHKKLIDQILKRKAYGEQAVLVAFLSGKPALLTSEERKHYLESLGIDVLLECPLSKTFCSMSAEDFVKHILVERLDTRFLAVGEDYRFGAERKGDIHLLLEMGKELGYHTEVVEKEMDGDQKVSSTLIREELEVGHMERVQALLGRPFVVEGVIEHGRGMGKRDFFPTINQVPPAEKLMPPNGVYATRTYIDGTQYLGITNVGYKPTVGEKFLGVETHLFQCDKDLYGSFAKVELMTYQRPELKFASFEALKSQISQDIKNGECYFSAKNGED